MKMLTKFLLCLGALVLTYAPSTVFAAPCVQASLANYIALGAGGCTIDDKTFANFGYIPSGTNAPPSSAAITVNPHQNGSVDGVTFASLWSLTGTTTNLTMDSNISFTVAVIGGAALIDDASFAVLSGLGITGQGQLTVTEGLCATGSSCPPNIANLFAAGTSTSISLGDHKVFSNIGAVTATKDIGLLTCLGGPPCTGGSVTFSSITDDFSQVVPLPAALPLFAGGLGALGLLGWRRKRQVVAA